MSLVRELPKTTVLYYKEDFYKVLVKQFPYFITKELFDVRDINGVTSEIYRGDFYGLLLSIGVPYEMHRINTEFNNLISSIDYPGLPGSIRILRANELEKMSTIYKTTLH